MATIKKATKVPNGPLIKKKGEFKGSTLKKGGKVMLKRADGSYSQRGLWDNIRANKGSGKKPTAEMLKQEKKIKKAQNGKKEPKYTNIDLMHWGEKPSAKDSADYRSGFYKGVSDIKKGMPKSKTQYNPQFGVTEKRLGYAEAYENPKKKTGGKIKKAKTGAWQRKEGKNPSGGLNAKGRASYNRETGGHLKPPQPGGGPRKRSFCARMSGVKGPMKKPNGKPTRKALALRKWKC